jgi:hypothetical protein
VNLEKIKTNIESNMEFTLTWPTSIADTCSTAGNWSGDKPKSILVEIPS